MKGKELRRRRLTMDLKQEELADMLGVTSNTISRYETESIPIPRTVELALETVERQQLEAERKKK